MKNTHSFLTCKLDAYWHKRAFYLLFLSTLALSLLAFAISKYPVHITHSTLLADAGSTLNTQPTNLGGGGPWQ